MTDLILVEQIMNNDLITMQEDDSVEMVYSLMDWKKVRHIVVENTKGELVGLLTSGILLRNFVEKYIEGLSENKNKVKDIMLTDVVSVSAGTTIKYALSIMRENKIGCLPVTENNTLLGIITEHDMLVVLDSVLK